GSSAQHTGHSNLAPAHRHHVCQTIGRDGSHGHSGVLSGLVVRPRFVHPSFGGLHHDRTLGCVTFVCHPGGSRPDPPAATRSVAHHRHGRRRRPRRPTRPPSACGRRSRRRALVHPIAERRRARRL